MSVGTIHNNLHENLGLTKKSVRWVPKLLSDAQKLERVSVAKVFKNLKFHMGEDFLSSIVTMDETMVSFYTPETRESSKQWTPRGDPVPN